MNNWQESMWYVVGILGILIAVGLTVGIIFLVRNPLQQFLSLILKDDRVARIGATFVLILIGLRGVEAILEAVSQQQLNFLFNDLNRLLNGIANDIQWVVYVAALLFIGYSIQGWHGRPEEKEEEK